MTAVAAGVGLLLMVVTALAVAAPNGRSGPDSNSGEAQRLRELERTRQHALVKPDISVLRQILAPDFRLISPDGEPLSRKDYLDALASGDLVYRVFKAITPIKVRLYGKGAVLTYESQLDVVGGGERLRHKAWHTYVYEQRDGRWQLVWEQATALGGFPPPQPTR